jgi:phage terminase large subunit GpA-like protein
VTLDVLPGGAKFFRYDLNVDTYKDRLYRLYYLSQAPGPGYGHLHRDTSAEVIDQLTAEEKVIISRGRKRLAVWQPKKGRRDNHYWDCDVYATAAAELAGFLGLPPLEDFEQQVQAEARPSRPSPAPTNRKIRTHYD